MQNVAELVIAKCGGPKVVADLLGLTLASVHRWKYPVDRGGSGGLIPAGRQATLLDKARAAGIDLRPADFFKTDAYAAPAIDSVGNAAAASPILYGMQP